MKSFRFDLREFLATVRACQESQRNAVKVSHVIKIAWTIKVVALHHLIQCVDDAASVIFDKIKFDLLSLPGRPRGGDQAPLTLELLRPPLELLFVLCEWAVLHGD